LTFAVLAAAISGVAVFVNGYGVRAVPDATVYTTAKNLFAALVLVAVALIVRRSGTAPAAGRAAPRRGLRLAVVAVVGGSIPFVLFFEGLSRASSTHAAFVHKTLFIWVAVLAVPLLGERLRPVHAAALVLLIGGLLALEGGLAGFEVGAGEALILAATLLWTVEVIVAKRLLRDVAPATVALSRMAGGVVVLLAWLGVTGRLGVLVQLDPTGWLWAAVTSGILATYVLTWFTALALAPAIDVTAVLVLGAVLTGLLQAVARSDLPGLVDLAGMASLVLGATVLVAGARSARPRRVTEVT
jgi:drug/metabolite transporter (DMT)-like permease